jgi:hypothetical protein
MIIKLTPKDMEDAARVGKERFEESRKNRRRDTLGHDSERSHILGAIGECAVAAAIGMPWSQSVNTFKSELDVGRYEVRTRSTSNGELIIRQNDPSDRMFVLVVPAGSDPREWCIAGQMRASHAMQPTWWRTDRGDPPAWFVPQQFLTPFMGLR